MCEFLEAVEQHKETSLAIAVFIVILATIIFDQKSKE